MLKSYKFRLYPNKEQELLIQKTFGCVRFVYNQCLAYKIDKYKNEEVSLSKIDVNNYKNRTLKTEYEWLKEVDKFALDNAVINLDSAYQKFFKEHKGFLNSKARRIIASLTRQISQAQISRLILIVVKSNCLNSNG